MRQKVKRVYEQPDEPCPFCGSDVYYYEDCENNNEPCGFRCPECGYVLIYTDPEMRRKKGERFDKFEARLREKWNRRF